jgi:5-methylcytosine-specific restriction endonuclease McrA
MRFSISEKIRKAVAIRANYRCEYCKIHNDDMFLSFELDHILPLKHGGTSDIENLAFACPHCNQHKGSDFATIFENQIIRLFNPRTDAWKDHFETVNDEIILRRKSE